MPTRSARHPACLPAHATAQDLLALAQGAIADGRLDDAEAAYAQTLAQAPDHRDAWLGLGQCARLRGDREAALAAHQALVEATGGADPWSLLQAAFDLHVLGRLDEAERAYRAVVDIVPDQRESLFGIGQCARLRGDREAAAAAHRAAASAFPGDPQPHLQLAFDLQVLRRFDQADAAYRAALALDPAEGQALLGIAHCARARGDRAASLAAHQAAFLASGDEAARLQVAIDLHALGRVAEAADTYDAVLRARPDECGALLGLARLRRDGGQQPAALALFRQAAALPGGDAALIELVQLQADLEGDAAARRTAEEAVARVPSVQAAMALGLAERLAGRHAEAFAAFAEALRLEPGAIEPRLEMAAEARALARPADCDRLLAEAAAIDPDHPHTLNQQAFHAMIQGEPARALSFYERAASLHPDILELQLGVIEALAVCGQPREAFARLDALDHAGRAPLPVALKRIDLLHRSGHWREALDQARTLTLYQPQDIQAWMSRALVELFLGEPASLGVCLARLRGVTGRARARALLLAGLAAERAGDPDRADLLLGEAIGIEPTNPECLTHLTRLALLRFDLHTARRHLVTLSASQSASLRLQRRSANPSQTLFGQLLDEYALDDAVEALAPLRHADPAGRLPLLLQLVARHPDSTASAIATLQELARLGLIASPCPSASVPNDTIPRRIAQYWDKTIPSDVAGIMQSWRDHNPDHEIRIFDRASALAWLRRHHQPQVARAFEQSRESSQAADLFRLAYLAREGGLYVDADDRCLAPVDRLLPPGADLVLYQEDIGSIGNNVIAAVPGHEVVRRALALATAALGRGDADIVWLSTGPGLLSRAFALTLADAPDPAASLDRVRVLDRHDLFRAVAIHCLAAYKVAGRHWSKTAFQSDEPPPADSRWGVTVSYAPRWQGRPGALPLDPAKGSRP